jgi:hypothetical protein
MVFVAVLVAYSRMFGLPEHVRQYSRMRDFHARASDVLKANRADPGRCQTIIKDLGREALIENGDWLVFHRHAPLEVP